MDKAAETIMAQGASLERPVPLISLGDACKDAGYEIEDLMSWFSKSNVPGHTELYLASGFKTSLKQFLDQFEEVSVHSLDELIQFNDEHADEEMPEGNSSRSISFRHLTDMVADHPGQQALIGARDSTMSQQTFEKALDSMRSTAQAAIDKTLADSNIDVILGPADARMASVAAVAGYPIGSVPLGYADFNGRAFGMNMIAKKGEEAKMLEVMSAWEASFPDAHRPPPMLVDWDSIGANI